MSAPVRDCFVLLARYGDASALRTLELALQNEAPASAERGLTSSFAQQALFNDVGPRGIATLYRHISDTPIVAYAAKYASAFYGPFREVAESEPAFGDRRGYQMDPANVREALRECELDLTEGADVLMVKPALPYLDVIRAVRERFDAPVWAYQVSGEYAMVRAAADAGHLEEKRAALEALTAIRRAGAGTIVTYWAKDLAEWL